MSTTYEAIKKANDEAKTTMVKDKSYIEVNERIKAFRKVYPMGFINNEMISNENGVCIFKSTVGIETEKGIRVLGVGHAYEKEGSTFINKTSYIENCETSATGRALGMAGFGIDTSVASAEEVQNAINNQPISKKEQEVLKNMVESKGYKVEEIFPNGLELTPDQYIKACQTIEKMKKKGEK